MSLLFGKFADLLRERERVREILEFVQPFQARNILDNRNFPIRNLFLEFADLLLLERRLIAAAGNANLAEQSFFGCHGFKDYTDYNAADAGGSYPA